MSFRDRIDAGRRLAEQLRPLRGRDDIVVLGLPRGGVPVAAEVARSLGAPLDVIVVRKVGAPGQPELALGAVGEDGEGVVNVGLVRALGVSQAELRAAQDQAHDEVRARVGALRGHRPRVPLAGRTAIVVDDGVATGATARAACRIARAAGAARVMVAVPVAPADAVESLAGAADEVVSLLHPTLFGAVGQFYDDFSQTPDAEVTALLAESCGAGPRPAYDAEVVVDAGGVALPGRLTIPAGARGIVVFAHGSGSGRGSPRNRHVAEVLHGAALGTLLFDLLTEPEASQRSNVFDIGLLAGRLLDAVAWLRGRPEAGTAPVGFFGASTGGAAALAAAATLGTDIAAVVSRGGRPDLAGDRLAEVHAPTLLIVGGDDHVVLELNRDARRRLHCPNRLAVVPGAGHLFEEPGALDVVAGAAVEWFTDHLAPDAVPATATP